MGYAAVAGRVFVPGLRKAYRGLWCYVLFRALRSLALRLSDPVRSAYVLGWLLSEPVVWALFAYAVFEVSAVALRDYRGLASLSRVTLIGGLVVSLLVSVATLAIDWSQSRGDFPLLLGVNLARRAIYCTFTFYLLILAGFLVGFPVPVSRNLLLHTVLLALYSITGTAALFVRNLLGPSVIPQVSLALLGISVVCQAGWLCLTPGGELRPAAARPHWSPETERHLLAQLSALNASLSRSADEGAGRLKSG